MTLDTTRDGPITGTGTASVSEPTSAELVARAAALVPDLIAAQAETEALTRTPQHLVDRMRGADLYRVLVPRRYGGLEKDLAAFTDIVTELARGCPSTAWGYCLAARHVVQVATLFPRSAQDAILSADFLAASVAAPTGTLREVENGWVVEGTFQFASGSVYSTHYLGQAFPIAEPGGKPIGPPAVFIAPREAWTQLDDWGWTLGLRGSGSNGVRFDGAVIPHDHVLLDTFFLDLNVSEGTAGSALYENPLYSGRTVGPISLDVAALMTGMALGALDEYEKLLETKRTVRPPITTRADNGYYLRWAGKAAAQLDAARALIRSGCEKHAQACRDQQAGVAEFTARKDLETVVMGREAVLLAWDAMSNKLFRSAGTTATGQAERMSRIWRDMSTAWTHIYNSQGEMYDEDLGRARLGR
ncbi:acyl-CoA dehydrogenase family protein [Rhodococcus sp. BP-149]|uniref:acyl-CoA dehydrogenase family protein n=1 Tax=unclassified Rhodococcus (in: high G+C Gram-positive bacteria) TaxID=192944 RepID=UPI001C9A60D9|nr:MULTISPECIES: acyl-CoA dehydrogenase family protein [unclassified Rhodococcus (in: high G+C Gram-positive bacteria)]MBY6685677.1 acyl-CoA dehydrogenase family protein [Rhodococcus sp. BP-288]MBY6694775.1 acyl-CoA dehydrogenase family protein [Rhodococcus sp. BP-188]MBY6696621.1 acyl-CoA dehydrogenase family protein [Rhodococcus sp. BP-285]MBY6703277.1 acyl-CoA dehydrogenase family protein [Rhodococcus sp. BP-283]MBY6710769.1 acyl-CoA dehydrogenase family protein [Rhodococcus sp. BP-160]